MTVTLTTSEPQLAAANSAAQTAKPAKRWSRAVATDVVALFDGSAVFLGAAVPALIYGSVGGIVTNWTLLAQTSFAASLIAHLCLRFWGHYDANRVHEFPVNPAQLLTAVFIGVLSMSSLGLPHALQNDHIWVWLLTWISASYTFLLMSRGLAQAALAKLTASGRFNQRVADRKSVV